MTLNEQQQFRRWLTKLGHNVLPSRVNGKIEFQVKGQNEISFVRFLARGGIDADAEGDLLYLQWKASGVRQGTFVVSPPNVTSDVAVELFVHHVQLAVSYFEASPNDEGAQILQEAARIMGVAEFGEGADFKGLKALVKALVREYAVRSEPTPAK